MNQQDNDGLNFSRGIRGPLGKLEVDEKTKLDEHTAKLWAKQCALRGQERSVVQRDLIYLAVYGKTWSQMAADSMIHAAERNAAIAKLLGPIEGPEFEGGQ